VADLPRYPQACATLLTALQELLLHPPEIIIIRGEQPAIGAWQREPRRALCPRRLLLAVPKDAPRCRRWRTGAR
jgi:hypothetical protein